MNLAVADRLTVIHPGRIAGKKVDPTFVNPGATITVVKNDNITSDTFTGERVPVAPFNGAPPLILQTAVVTIDVEGWQAEREVAVAETFSMIHSRQDLAFLWNLGKHLMCPEPVLNEVQIRAQSQKAEDEVKADQEADEWLPDNH